jgi:hypothetical protein
MTTYFVTSMTSGALYRRSGVMDSTDSTVAYVLTIVALTFARESNPEDETFNQ